MNNEVKFVSPFKKLCITVGNLPTAYIESMSYYEGLTYLVNYLSNNVIPALNNNSEVVEELQNYVETYFDNLDVQEEVNKKLDEMAQDGTLAEIINVEMIGELDNLTTEDKSNLVNAINETNSALSNISTITLANISGDTDMITNLYSGNYAWSSNSIWFKFFADLTLSSSSSEPKTLTFALPNGFDVTETYTITNAGLFTDLNPLNTGGLYGMASITVSPTGISITYSSATPLRLTLLPFMYYNGTIES